jgi:hypothetical protein
MTAQPEVPISLAHAAELTTASKNGSVRMLGSARRLLLHGLVVIAAAVLLGVAEAVSLWMGALLVGFGLLVAAGSLALIGIIGRFGATSTRPR